VQAQWAVMQASPRLAGGAIWMFQDQGILRSATPEQTPASSHDLGLAVWPDDKHYYDTHGNQGMDGIVYADRTPQVDYWQVRKVYSPVQISAAPHAAKPGRNEIKLWVENRFDFRSLTGITLRWTLERNGVGVQEGSIPLQAAARTAESVTVACDLPAEIGSNVHIVKLRCHDEAGISFNEESIPLAGPVTPTAVLNANAPTGEVKLVESPERLEVQHPGYVFALDRRTGLAQLRDAAGTVLVRAFGPHAGRRFTEGEVVRAKREGTWAGVALQTKSPALVSHAKRDGAVIIRVEGIYARTDAADQSLHGFCELTFQANGTIAIDYDFEAEGRGMLLEAGLALQIPADASEFRWIGAGPYAGYPGKDRLNAFGIFHLGRADLNFQGNRRDVAVALLTTPTGTGVAVSGEGMEIAVERDGDCTKLSHNAVISGRGTKFVAPDTLVKAEEHPRIAGHFTLHPLSVRHWPQPLLAWFGEPKEAAKAFNPYFHSYDQ